MGQRAEDLGKGYHAGIATALTIVRKYLLHYPDECDSAAKVHAAISNNILEFILSDLERVRDSESPIRLDIEAGGSAIPEHFFSAESGQANGLGSQCAPTNGTAQGSPGHNNSGHATEQRRLYLIPGGLSRTKNRKGDFVPHAS